MWQIATRLDNTILKQLYLFKCSTVNLRQEVASAVYGPFFELQFNWVSEQLNGGDITNHMFEDYSEVTENRVFCLLLRQTVKIKLQIFPFFCIFSGNNFRFVVFVAKRKELEKSFRRNKRQIVYWKNTLNRKIA
jgi:hypothetical protein